MLEILTALRRVTPPRHDIPMVFTLTDSRWEGTMVRSDILENQNFAYSMRWQRAASTTSLCLSKSPQTTKRRL